MKKLLALGVVAVGSVVLYEYLRKNGVVDQIKGEIESFIGAATGDNGLKVDGFVHQTKGKAKEAIQDFKEAAVDAVDDVKDYFHE